MATSLEMLRGMIIDQDKIPIEIITRVHHIRSKGKIAFVEVRERDMTIQVVFNSKELAKRIEGIIPESVVEIKGVAVKTTFEIKKTSFHYTEIQGDDIKVLSSSNVIPLQVSDTEKVYAHLDTRLNNRVLDLRNPRNQSIMRIRSDLQKLLRDKLAIDDFIEINTPKLTKATPESGAEVFRVEYFGADAYLAQSPQLYKQMMINAGFRRVFEIGSVFRAEKSVSVRHLTEFTGVDIEMEFEGGYSELYRYFYSLLRYAFVRLADHPVLDIFQKYEKYEPLQIPDEPVVVEYSDALKMLEEAKFTVERPDNLNNQDELRLGQLVKDKYNSDIFILDGFPRSARPFYTMFTGERTHSYDILIRGREVLSGGERINDPEILKQSIDLHKVSEKPLKDYIESFNYGTVPHGGGGFGLDRLVWTFLDLQSVQEVVPFPRTPGRLSP